jgi:hypothetical protein
MSSESKLLINFEDISGILTTFCTVFFPQRPKPILRPLIKPLSSPEAFSIEGILLTKLLETFDLNGSISTGVKNAIFNCEGKYSVFNNMS